MEKSRRGKENVASIADMFKVKKCLFNQPLGSKIVESDAPKPKLRLLASPVTEAMALDDSPYSLFKVKKSKSVLRAKISASVEYSPYGSVATTPTNKKYPIEEINEKMVCDSPSAAVENDIKLAVQKSIMNPNLIGDFTKLCALPTIRGKHPDLKTISPETVASLVNGSKSVAFSLIDCRYPYEYNAGHIKNALNIYVKDDIVKSLLNESKTFVKEETKEVLIFYCEFSSERGPSMLRHLRSSDRDVNKDCYPFLFYPELYIMEGGYSAFFSCFKELCDPPEYKTMLDKDCSEQLAYYRSMSKSSKRRSKFARRSRPALVF